MSAASAGRVSLISALQYPGRPWLIGADLKERGNRLRYQHRRAGEAALAQIGKRLIGLRQRIGLRHRANGDRRREGEEFLAVLPRQICDRADNALFPQQLVGKARNVAHMDAGADDGGALRARRERRRHQGADRREDQRGIEQRWRLLARAAGPFRAETQRKFLPSAVAVAGEGEDTLAT